MAAYQKHKWSFGEEEQHWAFLFFKTFHDNSDMHLDFKKWLQVFLLNGSISDIEFYYFLLTSHDKTVLSE